MPKDAQTALPVTLTQGKSGPSLERQVCPIGTVPWSSQGQPVTHLGLSYTEQVLFKRQETVNGPLPGTVIAAYSCQEGPVP